jgi:hypothetical protein
MPDTLAQFLRFRSAFCEGTMTSPTEVNLLAALADAELLRHEVTSTTEQLRVERHRVAESEVEIQELRSRLVAADERQRELHVLLLHRDEEMARLHGYVERFIADQRELPRGPTRVMPSRTAPEVAHASLAGGLRVAAQVESGLNAAARWWAKRRQAP